MDKNGNPPLRPPRTPSMRLGFRKNLPSPPEEPFAGSPHPPNGRMTPKPTRYFEVAKAASAPPVALNDENRTRNLTRGAPGDLPDLRNLKESWTRQQLLKKKSQYYDDAFATRDLNNTARDRVSRDSIVAVSITLNCVLQSIQVFLLDLSFQLSEIFQRPESSIMASISPETPMLFGGNSEPAYLMTISALQSEIAPTKNKRNASLLQTFMSESLSIASNRGVIRFEAIAAENLANNGTTALQEIEEMESRGTIDGPTALRTISRNRSRRGKKNDRMKDSIPEDMPLPSRLFRPATSTSGRTITSVPEEKKLKQRKSIMAFFGR